MHLINIKRVAYAIKNIEDVVNPQKEEKEEKEHNAVQLEEIICKVLKALKEAGEM